jgi:hypothetical protein
LVPLLVAVYGLFAFCYLIVDPVKVPVQYRAAYALSYTTIEYLFFAFLFFKALHTASFRKIILALSVAFILFQVIYYFNVRDDRFRLDTVPIGVETILLFVYTFFFFYESMKSSHQINLYSSFAFWVAIGILLYLGASFFLFILANDLRTQEIETFWDVTYVAETIKNIVFCVAILTYVSNPNQPKKNMSRSPDSVPHLI